jgi:glycosyltransferase involved in cell wall biosynthesis
MIKNNGLTVIVPTYNVEIYLDNLLSTVENWADEVIVCDSFSTDKTLAIAQKHKVKILRHEYINSAKQKNWAIPQAANEWVMIIDSDELPEDELKKEISDFLTSVPDNVHLAHIPRKNKFWGKLYGNGFAYPDYQSRLFRRDKGRYQDKEVHAQVEVPGRCVHLKNALVHDDFTDISSWWLRNNRYYRYELDEFIKRGKKWGFKVQIAKPLYVFLHLYLRKGYIRYGFPGLFVAIQWFIYYFMVGAKLYEHELSQKRKITYKSANSK